MSDDMICLPRAVMAALVDPQEKPYMRNDDNLFDECAYCAASDDLRRELSHADDCPVRIAQEALTKEQP